MDFKAIQREAELAAKNMAVLQDLEDRVTPTVIVSFTAAGKTCHAAIPREYMIEHFRKHVKAGESLLREHLADPELDH